MFDLNYGGAPAEETWQAMEQSGTPSGFKERNAIKPIDIRVHAGQCSETGGLT